MREGWTKDTGTQYPRYRYKDTVWVVFKRYGKTPRWTAYRSGEYREKFRFQTVDHAMIYAETMEAVGA